MLSQSMRPQNSMQRGMVLRKGEPNLRLLSIQEKVLASTTSQSLTENSTKTRSAAAGTKSCMHCEVYEDVVADTAELMNCTAATPHVSRRWHAVMCEMLLRTPLWRHLHSLSTSGKRPPCIAVTASSWLCNEGNWHAFETLMAAGLSHACCWVNEPVTLSDKPLSEQGAPLYPAFPARLLSGRGRHRSDSRRPCLSSRCRRLLQLSLSHLQRPANSSQETCQHSHLLWHECNQVAAPAQALDVRCRHAPLPVTRMMPQWPLALIFDS